MFFWYTSSFNWNSGFVLFIIKVRIDTPIFNFLIFIVYCTYYLGEFRAWFHLYVFFQPVCNTKQEEPTKWKLSASSWISDPQTNVSDHLDTRSSDTMCLRRTNNREIWSRKSFVLLEFCRWMYFELAQTHIKSDVIFSLFGLKNISTLNWKIVAFKICKFSPERSKKTGKISINGDASWFILTRSVKTSYFSNLHVEFLAFSIECLLKKSLYVCTTQKNFTKKYP